MAGFGGYAGYRKIPLALLEGLGDFLRQEDGGLCLSAEGKIGFCYAPPKGKEPVIRRRLFGRKSFYLLCQSSEECPAAEEWLLYLYLRYGKEMRANIPFPCRYAVYDGARHRLLLGATEGRIYLKQKGNGVWFADRAGALPGAVAVETALFGRL